MKSRTIYSTNSKSIIFIITFITIIFAAFPLHLSAKVSGICSNCHTMHNSQDGIAVDAQGANSYLIKGFSASNACAGCHSSASGATWKDSVTGAPIVWNQSVPTFNAQKGLAGGNFYWVSQGANEKGHNVYGVAQSADSLATAPGRNILGCTNSCHDTLYAAPNIDNKYKGGCEGCHVYTSHHDDSNNWFRFLKSHGQPAFGATAKTFGDYVTGVEDSDWEKTVSASDHNFYKGTTIAISGEYSEGNALSNFKTITAYCQGCHGVFHGKINDPSVNDGMGSSTPWIRHPTDIKLPDTVGAEYTAYNPVTAYSPEAPVAWVNPGTPARAEAVVMCLSCHRPHGSEYPDMLRWDYNGMVVGTTGGSAGTGCFTCHTDKDG